jgi:hypothetical protein
MRCLHPYAGIIRIRSEGLFSACGGRHPLESFLLSMCKVNQKNIIKCLNIRKKCLPFSFPCFKFLSKTSLFDCVNDIKRLFLAGEKKVNKERLSANSNPLTARIYNNVSMCCQFIARPTCSAICFMPDMFG